MPSAVVSHGFAYEVFVAQREPLRTQPICIALLLIRLDDGERVAQQLVLHDGTLPQPRGEPIRIPR
jgi:hypothetical protein